MGTDHVELKQLTTRREQAQRRLQALLEEQVNLRERIIAEEREIASVNSQIGKLQEKARNQARAVIVTEHAILRYLERVKGLDIDKVKKEMVPDLVSQQIRAMGNGEYPAGTHSVRVKDNTVITIFTKEEKPPREAKPPVKEASEGSRIIDPKTPAGPEKCLKCNDATDRLLKGGLCAQCVEEGYSLE